jgi:hypothetical protein
MQAPDLAEPMKGGIMRARNTTALVCGFLIVLFSFPAIPSSPSVELLLKDVDEILIHARVDQKGMLWVTVNYESRAKGQSVYWTGGRVDCDCEVYEYEDKGAGDEGKRGRRITGVNNTLLTDKDKISVDIPAEYLSGDKSGMVECSFNTGSERLKAQDHFQLNYGSGPGPIGEGEYHVPAPVRRERHRGQ